MLQKEQPKYGFKLTIFLLIIVFILLFSLIYTFFKSPIDSSIAKIKKDLFWQPRKLTSKEINSAQQLQDWFAYWKFAIPEDLGFIKSEKWEKLECTNTAAGGTFAERDISAQIKDSLLLKALPIIRNREYKEADLYTEKDGKLVFLKSGERKKKFIMYESLCQARGNYFVIFTTTDTDLLTNSLVKTAFAGGGMYWGPQNLAVISNKKIEIIERIGKKRSVAYWLCSKVIGVAGNNLYLGCSGGDGPAGASSLNKIDLTSLKNQELVYCQSAPAQETYTAQEVKCLNSQDALYFKRIEPLSVK